MRNIICEEKNVQDSKFDSEASYRTTSTPQQ